MLFELPLVVCIPEVSLLSALGFDLCSALRWFIALSVGFELVK